MAAGFLLELYEASLRFRWAGNVRRQGSRGQGPGGVGPWSWCWCWCWCCVGPGWLMPPFQSAILASRCRLPDVEFALYTGDQPEHILQDTRVLGRDLVQLAYSRRPDTPEVLIPFSAHFRWAGRKGGGGGGKGAAGQGGAPPATDCFSCMGAQVRSAQPSPWVLLSAIPPPTPTHPALDAFPIPSTACLTAPSSTTGGRCLGRSAGRWAVRGPPGGWGGGY
jgi:hypothetical protein